MTGPNATGLGGLGGLADLLTMESGLGGDGPMGLKPSTGKGGRKGLGKATPGKKGQPGAQGQEVPFDNALALMLSGAAPGAKPTAPVTHGKQEQGEKTPSMDAAALNQQGAAGGQQRNRALVGFAEQQGEAVGLSRSMGADRSGALTGSGHASEGQAPAGGFQRAMTAGEAGTIVGLSADSTARQTLTAAAPSTPPAQSQTPSNIPQQSLTQALPTEALQDTSLRGAINPRTAHLQLEGANGPISLHVTVQNGEANLRVEGAGAAELGSRETELRLALSKEGIALGRMEQGRSTDSTAPTIRPVTAIQESSDIRNEVATSVGSEASRLSAATAAERTAPSAERAPEAFAAPDTVMAAQKSAESAAFQQHQQSQQQDRPQDPPTSQSSQEFRQAQSDTGQNHSGQGREQQQPNDTGRDVRAFEPMSAAVSRHRNAPTSTDGSNNGRLHVRA